MPIKTIKSDVFKFLEKASLKFNIIFADPPYAFTVEQFSKIPELVFQNNLLEDGGVLIVEHSKETNLSQLEYYHYSKSYGGNMFSFFEHVAVE
ncbi:MAG: hypothetical protein B7Z06_10405 [Flavobacteriales bacterium 32-35-8]|nr:MAG: hypothetical protein B7Z06_10405 [Flavobacteriales bacterium 32-35-8]